MSEKQINWMVEQVKAGKLARREFIGHAGALGVGVVTAGSMLVRAGVAEEPIWGGEATFGTEYTGAEETYDPTKMTNSTDIQRAYQTYNRLTNLDRDMNVVPNLAVEWEAANDATEWTFKLREGVEFHNGKTFTAEDVIYSIQEHIKEGSESPSKPVLEPIIDLQADGPNVLKITLNSGDADFPVILGHDYHTSIVPAGWKDGDEIVGTGPYAVKSFTPGLESVQERFANYWNELCLCLDLDHAAFPTTQRATAPCSRAPLTSRCALSRVSRLCWSSLARPRCIRRRRARGWPGR